MKNVFAVFLVLILSSVFLYAEDGGILASKYSEVKVSANEDSIQLKNLLEKFSEETKINLVAGENGDWRVSERLVCLKVKDAFLENVMKGISNVTKLVWVKKDDDTYVLTYDPATDQYIDSLLGMVANIRNNARKQAVDNFLDTSDNPNLKDEDPLKYYGNESGFNQAVAGAIQSIPGMREALSNGSSMNISGSDLSKEAINNINLSGNVAIGEIQGFMGNRGRRGQGGRGRGNRGWGGRQNQRNVLPNDMSGVTLEVNSQSNNLRGTENFLLGTVVIKNNGRVIGGLPIMNTKSPLGKKMGEALLEMKENPGTNPRDLFQSMGGLGMLTDINKSTTDEVYGTLKLPLPDNEYFSREIELSAEPKSKSQAVSLLSEALNVPCYCDDFGSMADRLPFVSIQKKGSVREIIESINDTYGLTCAVADEQLSFYSLKWFEELGKLMPEAYLDKWNENLMNDEFISEETLREMGKFSREQLTNGLRKKPALATYSQTISREYPTVAFIGSLDDDAYNELKGKNGLSVGLLTDAGKERLCRINGMRNFTEKTKGVLKFSSEKFDNAVTYRFTAVPEDPTVRQVSVQLTLNRYAPLDLNAGNLRMPMLGDSNFMDFGNLKLPENQNKK